MATSLSIKGKTQGNDAVTSTINYVNPNATSAQLVSLATAMNNLTTNTVADITRIDKNSLVNTIEKQDRNMQLSPATIAAADISTDIASGTNVTLSLSGDDRPTWAVETERENSAGVIYIASNKVERFAPGGILALLRTGETTAATITVSLPETDTYKAATATLTITNG